MIPQFSEGIPLPSSPSDEGWVFYATASQPFRVQEAFQTQTIEFWRFLCLLTKFDQILGEFILL